MFNQGLEEEINRLKAAGYNQNTPGLKAIGYSEWFEYDDIEQIREEIKHHSCKYAKKQYTYIRDIPGSHVVKFDGSRNSVEEVAELIRGKV